MCPWILHDHDFLLSKGRNLHFHYLSAFVFLVEWNDSFLSESATDAVLRPFFTADPLGQHDLSQPVDTEATSQWSRPPHHDLRPQRQKLPVPHDLSPCEYISACAGSSLSATLYSPQPRHWFIHVGVEKHQISDNQTSFRFQWIPLTSV